MQELYMHSADRELTVAQSRLEHIIASRLVKSDDTLPVILSICADEVIESIKKSAPDQYCFPVMVAARGRWAATFIPRMTMHDFPKGKAILCNYICDAWLGCRAEHEEFFADLLRTWPESEAKEASNILRRIIDFRVSDMDGGDPIVTPRLARFFNGYTPVSRHDMHRTVFKALGRYAPMYDLMLMGRVFSALEGPDNLAVHTTLCALTNTVPR